jgi:hypothetical protein
MVVGQGIPGGHGGSNANAEDAGRPNSINITTSAAKTEN